MSEYRPKADPNPPLDLTNSSFLIITPLVAIVGGAWYAWHHGVTWLEWLNLGLMFVLSSVSVTGGYHRYFSHRSYECSTPVKLFYLVFGAAAVENSILHWASDHRYHHRYVDQPEDPYNILKGGFYAHMGWIFRKDTRDQNRLFENVPDLMKDPLVMWQHRWYLFLVVAVTFLLPTLIGLAGGRPMGGLLFGGFLRAVLVHHTTFFINSLAHLYGTKPYSLNDTARDSWWLAPLTFGEGYHNFHHKFQADYRNGVRWWQFDTTKWFIHVLSWFGQTWKLKRTSDMLILRARVQVQRELVKRRAAQAQASEYMWQRISARLDAGSARLHDAHARYLAARAEYKHRAREWSADMRRQWREQLESHQAEYQAALERWQGMMRAMNRLSQPSTARGLLTLTALVDLFRLRGGA